MKFRQSIVGFVDILGYSSMVERDSHSVEDPKYLKKISKVISAVSELGKGSEFEIRQFSDSIIAAIPYSVENFGKLAVLLGELQRSALLEEILLRGAVALGRHFSDQALVYSGGLIAAYNLERSKARYARIIVDRNLIDLITGTVPEFFKLNSGNPGTLIVDFDGTKFINYLVAKEIDLYEQIIGTMWAAVTSAEGTLAEKYAWLVRYYNYVRKIAGKAEIEFGIGAIKPFTTA